MKISILLLLVVVAAGLALPQRNTRRFFPRRGQADAEPEVEAAPIEVEEVVQDEPVRHRFKPSGRRLGSFTPRKSAVSKTPVVRTPAPVDSDPAVIAQPVGARPTLSSPRSRTRGSRTFLESVSEGKGPLNPQQIEGSGITELSLRKHGRSSGSVSGLASSRPSSRPSGRPSSRSSSGSLVVEASRTPSRSFSRPSSRSSDIKPIVKVEESVSEPESMAKPKETSGASSPSERQQILRKLKQKRLRTLTNVETKKSKVEGSVQEPREEMIDAKETETKSSMDKVANIAADKDSVIKLDENIPMTLDEKIKEEPRTAPGNGKQMVAKESDLPIDAEPDIVETVTLSSSTPGPEKTTTAAAPEAPRRVSSLTRLRTSRPSADRPRTAGPTRQRASTPVIAADGTPDQVFAPAAAPAPRLSSRRGGKGNSRGRAAIAASTRVSRPSSRGSRFRTPAAEETAQDEAQAEQAPVSPPKTTTTAKPAKFRPRVAPEDPRDAVNRGGFRFRPHDDSEADIRRLGGQVIVSEIGILEDTPRDQVRKILAGLGSRRRGLGRPSKKTKPTTTTTTEAALRLDYSYDDIDNYYYLDDY